LPLRTFDLRQVCYEGALERCCLVVGRLRPHIIEVAEQPPSVTSTTMAGSAPPVGQKNAKKGKKS
jgi:hypothetical protein